MVSKILVFSVLLLIFPLVGLVVAGRAINLYFQFPPLTQYVQHPSFSILIFLVLGVSLTVSILPFLVRIVRKSVFTSVLAKRRVNSKPFPKWGWIGIGSCGIFWFLAWTRFQWFSDFQKHTFTPLWISYIIIVNAMIYSRNGFSTFINRPAIFISLFPVSALFWWYFEYLNRFVQNWYYLGAEGYSSSEYVVYATISFSTVLPAVLSTKELLATYPVFEASFQDLIPIPIKNPRRIAWIFLIHASFGLFFVGVFPEYLFPLLWLSPLIIITSLNVLHKEKHIFSNLKHGNWVPVCTWSVAALICGFFWELWNSLSLAKWIYSIPYVHTLQVYEMPLLGYFGYLPFGLECAVVIYLFFPSQFIENEKKNSIVP